MHITSSTTVFYAAAVIYSGKLRSTFNGLCLDAPMGLGKESPLNFVRSLEVLLFFFFFCIYSLTDRNYHVLLECLLAKASCASVKHGDWMVLQVNDKMVIKNYDDQQSTGGRGWRVDFGKSCTSSWMSS